MRAAVLYSGGKDSSIALYKSYMNGYEISCLITLVPEYDDSMLFHHPNAYYTYMQAEALDIPLIQEYIERSSKDKELDRLRTLLREAKNRYQLDVLVSGVLSSRYQYDRLNRVAYELGLEHIAPCWQEEQLYHMHEIVSNGIVAILTSVSAYGLTDDMLGKLIDHEMIERLYTLSRRHGFNVNFEGGEAETFVLDMPLFNKRIRVDDYTIHWDGIRGYMEFRSLLFNDK